MREIVESVDLCDSSGRLSEAAVGWSRRPLHRCNLRSRWAKRWDYWCATDERWFLAVVVGDLGYLAGGAVSLIDLQTGERFERLMPLRGELGETVGAVHYDRMGMRLDLGGGRLFVHTGRLRVDLEVTPVEESLNVVVPFSDERFWFTSKQIGLPARGRIEWGDRIIPVDRAWASLDFGRGIWPVHAHWNWAAAKGERVAFNLGARWTDGTGATENGLFLDGKLIKIHDPVVFEPGWRIHSKDVELQFRPTFERRVGWPPRLGLHWCTGRFNGRVLDQKIEDLFGWAEALDILW